MSDSFDAEKLARLQALKKVGAKGTQRRKIVPRAAPADDQKLQGALKKLSVQPIAGVEEINMFGDDGQVIHFNAPKVHAAVPSNVFAIYGAAQSKSITDILPAALAQLGPEEMTFLQNAANTMQAREAANKSTGVDDIDDDEVPALVEAEPLKETGIEEIN